MADTCDWSVRPIDPPGMTKWSGDANGIDAAAALATGNIEACPKSAPTCLLAVVEEATPAPPMTARAARSMVVPAALQSAMLAILSMD